MPFFERFLSVWVGLAIVAGVALGLAVPGLFQAVAAFEVAHVNLAVAVFIWVMIYPMMIQIDFAAMKRVGDKPKGLLLTLVVNWLIKPFTMAALGWLFFKVLFADMVDPQTGSEYIAGAEEASERVKVAVVDFRREDAAVDSAAERHPGVVAAVPADDVLRGLAAGLVELAAEDHRTVVEGDRTDVAVSARGEWSLFLAECRPASGCDIVACNVPCVLKSGRRETSADVDEVTIGGNGKDAAVDLAAGKAPYRSVK